MKKLLLALILTPSLAFSQAMVAKVNYTDNEAKVTYGFAALPYETDCSVILRNEAGADVATVTSTEGGHKRIAIFTGLAAGTTYRFYISCGIPFEIVNNDSFVTMPDQGSATKPVVFNAGVHPLIVGGDRARVLWGSTSALSETPVQNTSCTSGCNISVTPVTPGVWYREWEWQTSADVLIKKAGSDCFLIGGSGVKNLTSSVNGEEPDIPSLALWEQYMTFYGADMCGATGKYRTQGVLVGTYYDAQWVMEEVADYVESKGGDPTFWRLCIDDATFTYRDGYVIPNHGSVPGYNTFTHGMVKSAIRDNNANPDDRNAVLWQAGYQIEDTIGVGAAYCSYSDWMNTSTYRQREHAYCLKNVINAKNPIFNIDPESGPNATNKIEVLYQQLIEDLRRQIGETANPVLGFIWDRSIDSSPPVACDDIYTVDSLYTIATANALISYDEELGDPGNHHAKTVEVLKYATDFLWTYMRPPGKATIIFTQCWTDPAPANPQVSYPIAGDLNLLYVDVWAWVYANTCEVKYRQQADDLFSYGIADIPRYIISSAKQYNQTYSYSFNYVRRRLTDPCP